MKVLSLFDGICCGMVALERAGIKVDTYYASEIDKNAIAISQKNYPNILRLGDVTKRAANPDDVGVCVPTKDGLRFRKFTLSEMEKMQTLPVGYTKVDGVSERQSKASIGNGWTVDVIAHILKGVLNNG